MDFLMLLPGRQRVVLEVDGSQHFTVNHGTVPSLRKYAETVAADRDLKFLGYHVYRRTVLLPRPWLVRTGLSTTERIVVTRH
ncbi:hypothetical protein ACFRAO_37515 [Streptomyces sp. NPDC056656]|uniref:hypothetical protein n=1 Tax=Streptomyces sp. NPDC056656 TaxID=3345895 RepID=UPI0036AF1969